MQLFQSRHFYSVYPSSTTTSTTTARPTELGEGPRVQIVLKEMGKYHKTPALKWVCATWPAFQLGIPGTSESFNKAKHDDSLLMWLCINSGSVMANATQQKI